MRKLIFVLFVIVPLTQACQNIDSPQDTDPKIDLTRSIMAMEDVKDYVDHEGKLILFESGFCEQNDCRPYFAAQPGLVRFCKREDLFMRKLEYYIEIKAIDTSPEGSFAEILLKKGDRFENRRISLSSL